MTTRDGVAKALHDTDPSHAGCERDADGHGPSGWEYYLRWADAMLASGALLDGAGLADEWERAAGSIEQDGTPEADVERFVLEACARQLRSITPEPTP